MAGPGPNRTFESVKSVVTQTGALGRRRDAATPATPCPKCWVTHAGRVLLIGSLLLDRRLKKDQFQDTAR